MFKSILKKLFGIEQIAWYWHPFNRTTPAWYNTQYGPQIEMGIATLAISYRFCEN